MELVHRPTDIMFVARVANWVGQILQLSFKNCVAIWQHYYWSRKIGSHKEWRSLKSTRIVASWIDDHGLISTHAGLRPGKVDCFVQHTSKIGSHC